MFWHHDLRWHHEDHADDPVPTNVIIGFLQSGTPGIQFTRKLITGDIEDTVGCQTLEALLETLRTFDPAEGLPHLTHVEAQASRARYHRRLPRLLARARVAWEDHLG